MPSFANDPPGGGNGGGRFRSDQAAVYWARKQPEKRARRQLANLSRRIPILQQLIHDATDGAARDALVQSLHALRIELATIESRFGKGGSL